MSFTQSILETALQNVIAQLGPWQRESTYRDALSAELVFQGFTVSTEVWP